MYETLGKTAKKFEAGLGFTKFFFNHNYKYKNNQFPTHQPIWQYSCNMIEWYTGYVFIWYYHTPEGHHRYRG